MRPDAPRCNHPVRELRPRGSPNRFVCRIRADSLRSQMARKFSAPLTEGGLADVQSHALLADRLRTKLHGRARLAVSIIHPCACRFRSRNWTQLLRPVLVRIVCDCGACREIAPEALVFLTRQSDIVFAGWASWRNTARHGSDAEATHENHQFRCAGCRSTANRGCVPGHLLRCAARCRAPSERGHHRAPGA
jgi:hypothetical protein